MGKYMTRKNLFFLALIVFVATMIPVFVIAGYTLPFYDDYNYGYLTAQAWKNTGSLFSVLKAAVEQASISYHNWQGTFTGIFFMALSPGIVNEFLYPLGIVMLILLFCGSTIVFLKVVLHDCLKMEKYATGIVSLCVLFLSIQFMLTPSEGLLWYNGGIYYIGFYSITLLMFAALLTSCRSAVKGKRILMGCCGVVLAFLVGGSNFVSGLTTCFALFLFSLYRLTIRKSRYLFSILSFTAILIAFLINVSAPGNKVRQDYFETPGVIGSIWKSMMFGIQFLTAQTKLPIVFAFLVILPLICEAASKSGFSFRYPGFVTLVTYGVYASSFTPTFYGMGWEGPQRALNISFLLSLLMILVNLYYWCGWFSKVLKVKFVSGEKGSAARKLSVALLICGFVMSMLGLALQDRDSMTSVSAVTSLRNGDAKGFYEERLAQLEMLKDTELTDLVFERHKYRPKLLYHTNLDSDPENSVNRCTAKYYGKNTVLCKPE